MPATALVQQRRTAAGRWKSPPEQRPRRTPSREAPSSSPRRASGPLIGQGSRDATIRPRTAPRQERHHAVQTDQATPTRGRRSPSREGRAWDRKAGGRGARPGSCPGGASSRVSPPRTVTRALACGFTNPAPPVAGTPRTSAPPSSERLFSRPQPGTESPWGRRPQPRPEPWRRRPRRLPPAPPNAHQ